MKHSYLIRLVGSTLAKTEVVSPFGFHTSLFQRPSVSIRLGVGTQKNTVSGIFSFSSIFPFGLSLFLSAFSHALCFFVVLCFLSFCALLLLSFFLFRAMDDPIRTSALLQMLAGPPLLARCELLCSCLERF